MHTVSRRRNAFTLVEVLMVAVILAILAVVVVPQFTDASQDVKVSSLRATLQTVRSQLELYKAQHGTYPDIATFANQMTQKTKADGTVDAAGKFGPYLQQMPINPFDDLVSVAATQDGSGGWAYDATSGKFQANDTSVTGAGSPSKDL